MSSGAAQLMVTEERVEEVTIRLSGGDGGGSADNNDNVHIFQTSSITASVYTHHLEQCSFVVY